ncbi:MAG: hypothetical protein IT428_03730 [Planctomycetaceae bacterium]|nr:hypothetical protein [Planctomycetaceae bacterium]
MELSADGAEPQFVGGDGARVNERRGGGDESRLILIFSDCVSEAWRSGQVFQCLAAWSRRATVGLLHALPESLWPRTSLGLGRVVRLRRKPGATGHAGFQAEPLNPWIDPPIGGGCLLPVADLRPGALRSLADFVAGGRTECAGILLPESETRLENAGQEPETDPSAEERVHRFKQMASPKAIQLAGLAAASPEISLQTMRLIRQSCLPEARQIHEAEFLLGGLVHAQRQDADVPRARDVPLRFHPGVEELLLDDLTGASMIDVLSLMSRHVEQRMGRSLEGFRALLADPSSIDTTVSEESPPSLSWPEIGCDGSAETTRDGRPSSAGSRHGRRLSLRLPFQQVVDRTRSRESPSPNRVPQTFDPRLSRRPTCPMGTRPLFDRTICSPQPRSSSFADNPPASPIAFVSGAATSKPTIRTKSAPGRWLSV